MMEPQKKIPFMLVTGFLGSGKTTFLLNLIRKYNHQYKIAVIQNEFAPGNIDGSIIRSEFENIEMLEINNGSVFCLCLLSDFAEKAGKFIAEYRPDVIILEASGLSDPLAIAEILQQEPLSRYVYLSKIWTLVDAVNFEKLARFQTTIQNQVRIAHEVIINKTDLNSIATDAIQTMVEKINPQAVIHATTYARAEISLDINETKEQSTGRQHVKPGTRPDIQVAVYKSSRVLDNLDVERLIQMMVEAEVIRAKGYLKISDTSLLAFQFSFGKADHVIMQNPSGRSELIVLGGSINPRKLRSMIEAAQPKTVDHG